jgi:hypothetical protein
MLGYRNRSASWTAVLLLCLCSSAWGQAPSVTGTFPAQNALDVAAGVTITAAFDEPMVAASFDASSVIVSGTFSGRYDGVIAYDSLTRTVSFDPDQDFSAGEIVTIALTDDIYAVSSPALVPPFVWSFIVAVADGPGAYLAERQHGADTNTEFLGAATADLDSDGDLDLVGIGPLETAAGANNSNVAIFLNPGDGVFAGSADMLTENTLNCVITADLDADGDVDLIVGQATLAGPYEEVAVYLNNGDGSFAAPATYGDTVSAWRVLAADLNGDGFPDLVSGGSGLAYTSINDRSGGFPDWTAYSGGQDHYFRAVAAGDVNHDGDVDLAVTYYNDSTGSSAVSVMLNDGAGVFSTGAAYPVLVDVMDSDMGDMDDDGDVDVVVIGAGGIDVLRNNGTGVLTSSGAFSAFVLLAGKLADVHGDGDLDVAAGNDDWPSADTGAVFQVYSNDGTGSLVDTASYLADSLPNRDVQTFCMGDVDGDGTLDVIAATYATTMPVLLNRFVFTAGDVNRNGEITAADIIYLVNYVFKAGPDPLPVWRSGDTNCDGSVTGADIIVLVNFIFKGGPTPCS